MATNEELRAELGAASVELRQLQNKCEALREGLEIEEAETERLQNLVADTRHQCDAQAAVIERVRAALCAEGCAECRHIREALAVAPDWWRRPLGTCEGCDEHEVCMIHAPQRAAAPEHMMQCGHVGNTQRLVEARDAAEAEVKALRTQVAELEAQARLSCDHGYHIELENQCRELGDAVSKLEQDTVPGLCRDLDAANARADAANDCWVAETELRARIEVERDDAKRGLRGANAAYACVARERDEQSDRADAAVAELNEALAKEQAWTECLKRAESEAAALRAEAAATNELRTQDAVSTAAIWSRLSTATELLNEAYEKEDAWLGRDLEGRIGAYLSNAPAPTEREKAERRALEAAKVWAEAGSPLADFDDDERRLFDALTELARLGAK